MSPTGVVCIRCASCRNEKNNKLSDDGTVTVYDESEWAGWSRAGRFRPRTILESDNDTEYVPDSSDKPISCTSMCGMQQP